MKKYIILIFILFVTFSFGQKKEIKKATKLFNAGDVQGATDLLESSASLFDASDPKTLNKKTYLEAQIDQTNKNFSAAFDKFTAFKIANGINANYDNQLQILTSDIVNSAIEDNAEASALKALAADAAATETDFSQTTKEETAVEDNAEKRYLKAANNKYLNASEKLYLAYQINPELNKDYLYYAASSSVNASELKVALSYYLKLKEINYDGITKQYLAKSVKTGEDVELSESEFNLFKKTKEYTDFREENTESKLPEIIKNIALIYVQLGDNEKAMSAVQEARKDDPKDLNLILSEANLYLGLNQNDRFESLMKQAIEQDPNNATLYYNIGVVNAKAGNVESARNYYKKAIELDENFDSSYLNLVSLILEAESPIREEMEGLGRSSADNKRYNDLTKKLDDLYIECVPILEKLISISPENEGAINTLMNIYGTLGKTEEYKKMKILLE
jgi:tetratricopeptide (TPR) repeat protein